MKYMGGVPAKIECLVEEIHAYATLKYAKIDRPLPDDFDRRMRQDINKKRTETPQNYTENSDKDWEELGNFLREAVDKQVDTVKKQQENEPHIAEKMQELKDYYDAQRKENYVGDILPRGYFEQIFDTYKDETDMSKFDEMIEREKVKIKEKIRRHHTAAVNHLIKLEDEAGVEVRTQAINDITHGWFNRLRQTQNMEDMEVEAGKIRTEEIYRKMCAERGLK